MSQECFIVISLFFALFVEIFDQVRSWIRTYLSVHLCVVRAKCVGFRAIAWDQKDLSTLLKMQMAIYHATVN